MWQPDDDPLRGSAAMRRTTAAISGIGTATPAGIISQADAFALAEEFSAPNDAQRAWFRRVFARAGVDSRGSVLANGGGLDDMRSFYTPEGSTCGPTTRARMERYAREAPVLIECAARDALAAAHTVADRVTHLITVSCTGFFAPGLDVALIGRLGLRRDVQRLHVGFMGCHAAFNALAAAREAVVAARAERREAVVLVCSVELCTLHFAHGSKPEKMVANALFGDGAGACVVDGHAGSDPFAGGMVSDGWRILDNASLLLPDSTDAMTWHVGDHGFEMTLSSELPALIGSHVGPWCDAWLGRRGMSREDVALWAIHPGGPKILQAAMEALGLKEEDVAISRQVLAAHGNLSSATLLFLLRELGQQQRRGRCVAIGFGPGLMAEGLLLER